MGSLLLSYQADSVLEHPIDGLELDRWIKLAENLAKFSDAPVVMINHAFERGVEVLASNKHSDNPYQQAMEVPLDCNIFCHHVIQKNAPLIVEDAGASGDWEDNPEYTNDGFRSYAGVPLEWPDGRVFGTLCILHQDAKHYSSEDLSLLDDFKDIIDFELKLVDQNRRLRALAVVDEMTGLYNRRGIKSAGKQLLALSNRYRRKIAAVYLDLDELKNVNDEFGHDFGDEVIKSAARVINGRIRNHDLAGRLGGDEFLMLCLVENEYEAQCVVGRLESCFAEASIELPNGLERQLSASIGVVIGEPKNERELEQLISDADQSMYQRKEARKS